MDVKGAAAKIRGLLLELEKDRVVDAEEIRRLRTVKMPPWVYTAVQGVLNGYKERERALRCEDGAPVVLLEYKRLNTYIERGVRAATMDCAPRIAGLLLANMIERKGYYNSLLADMMSERKYYELKRVATAYIAAGLYLI